jgi:hypothetical protein
MSRDAALAAFDDARDRFLAVFERVPDAALGFLPAGDDYAIGGVLPHLTWSIDHYCDILDTLVTGGFAGIPDPSDPAEADRVEEEARHGLDESGRPAALAALRTAHDRLAGMVRDLPESEFERSAPVVYRGSTEPYPTSAAAICGWVTDHYEGHIPHVGQLLTAYEATARS